MLEKLKHLDLDKLDIDQAVSLVAFGDMLIYTYEKRELEVPQWLTDNVRELNREITARHRDNLEKALKETDAGLEALKTQGEKREDLKARQERLRKALGMGNPTGPTVGQ